MSAASYTHVSSNDAYPALYDFALLPYALGDVLTWNVKTVIKSILAERKIIDLYLCADKAEPSFVWQKNDITAENFHNHLYDLLPAFFCTGKVRHIHIFTEREPFRRLLNEVDRTRPVERIDLENLERAYAKRNESHQDSAYLQYACGSHADINAFYSHYGWIPKLSAPQGFLWESRKFLEQFSAGSTTVALQFRLRALDTFIADGAPNRDSDFLAWYNFVTTVGERYPEVKFLLLGRLQEKPMALLNLPNVIAPRLHGLGLGHELAFITIADLFVGSQSGFAAMANFCDTPYLITKVSATSRANYGIPEGQDHLPFAGPHQILVSEEETTEILLSHFERIYGTLPKRRTVERAISSPAMGEFGQTPSSAENERSDAAQAHPFLNVERAIEQLRIVPLQALWKAQELTEGGRLAEAAETLEAVIKSFPEVAARLRGFHLFRAIVCCRMDKWKEADEAAKAELLFHPANPDAQELQMIIQTVLKQGVAGDLLRRGNDAMLAGDFSEARRAFLQVLQGVPSCVEAYVGLAHAEINLNNKAVAQAALAAAVEKASSNPALWNQIGTAYFKIGDIQNAVMCFNSALNHDSANLEARCNLAVVACNQKRPKEALEHFRMALEFHPNDTNLLVDYGRLASFLQLRELADSAFRKAAALGSTREEVRAWLQTFRTGGA